jgi:ABC-2 type transport system ATP-binding protein
MRYGSLTAVDGLAFTAHYGQVTAVLGPNGAGKTSTIEALEGFRRPAAGTVRVAGLDPIVDHDQVVRHIGVMLQAGGVYPAMRAGEAIALFCAYAGHPEDAKGLLDKVGLSARAKQTWKQLSGGEQQRLKLALALAGRPTIAFLDEPTAGVDIEGRLAIREIIRTLAAEGAAVVLTTHELTEAERLADHVVLLKAGRLVASGSLASLLESDQQASFTFSARPGLDVAALSGNLGLPVTERTPGEYHVACAPTPDMVARLTAWLAGADESLGSLRAGRRSLEDVFLELMGDTSGQGSS